MGRAQVALTALQIQWYQKLKDDHFEDIEDHDYHDKPLKKWSGVSISLDYTLVQPPQTAILSSFPEPIFGIEEELIHHPRFLEVCNSLCTHGNHSLSSYQVREIWVAYQNGGSCRSIAEIVDCHYTAVFRVIKKLREWNSLLENDMEHEESPKIVVLRQFQEGTDAPFLYATWRNSLWYDEERDDRFSHAFFSRVSKEIKAILADPKSQVRVACLHDDPDLIVGYSVITGGQLLWVYVKGDYRTKGIGTLLGEGHTSVYNPKTKIGRAIAEKRNLKIEGKNGNKEA